MFSNKQPLPQVQNVKGAGVGHMEYTDINGQTHTLANQDEVVNSISGTANQITVAGTGIDPVIELADNPVLPGNAGVTIPGGTTAQRPSTPVTGMLRFNTDI